ncbi:MAG TPA: amidohydrolase family protein [Bryobacteraceae bacterium]|nr:amidohydrolase family protein [Bryobacteraceae bacterium]
MREKPAASHDQWTLIRRARQLITLHGPSGPRRGAAMNELGIFNDGAVLIHHGAVIEAGPSRRIENLAPARIAREIDASGKLVLPAFVDPDAVLVLPPPASSLEFEARREIPLKVLSRHRLEKSAGCAAAELARYGILSVGAHTRNAFDLRDAVKVLRVQQRLQSKPLRIRSVFSPQRFPVPNVVIESWIPAIRRSKLASIVELPAGAQEGAPAPEQLSAIALASANLGLSLRLRSASPLDPTGYELATRAGAIAVIAPPGAGRECFHQPGDSGCVHVVPAVTGLRQDGEYVGGGRRIIDEGNAVALSSGYQTDGISSFNPQFLIYLAVERFGLTPEEAITAATWNAACSLRLAHVAGSIEPGKFADVVIMDAPDYRELPRRVGHNDVLQVMHAGETVYQRGALTLD